MTVTLSFIGGAGWQFFNDNGRPLAGGKIFTYKAGTTTPLTTYTSRDGLTPNTNPIILDAAGRTPQQIWATDGLLYKYVVTTSTNTLVRSWDNIGGAEVGNDLQADLANTSNNALGDNLIGFKQANAAGFLPGAVARTVSTKLQEFVSAKDFGAVGDGVTDDTAALKAAFDYAIPAGIAVELEGSYAISGPIQPYASRTSGSAHIICKGRVAIDVSLVATPFRDLFYLETSEANSCSITGGALTVNCNNRAASGITFRHNSAVRDGTVNVSCPVEILNCYNNDAAATYENQAILVFGEYETVVIDRPRVVNVSRTSANGVCKGISIAGFSGVVTINQPYAATVLAGPGTADADGIATFGKIIAGAFGARAGIVNINEPTCVDCQGRSIKSQCSDTTIFRPRVFRQNVVSIFNGVEFDFQTGGQSLLIEPYYEYRLNGSVSPIGGSFSCVAFQQFLNDKQNTGKSIGGVLRTEVLVPRYAVAIFQPTALAAYTEVSGLVVEPIGALTTTAIGRALIEFDAATVGAKSSKSVFAVRNCRGPIGTFALGYTSYDSSDLSTKLSFTITDNTNVLATAVFPAFRNLSGTVITQVENFVIRNNSNFTSIMPAGWKFNFNSLTVGSSFTVDLTTVVATNAPAWGSSGYAFIECLDQWFGANSLHIRVTVNDASVANTVFFTQGGVTPTWGTIR